MLSWPLILPMRLALLSLLVSSVTAVSLVLPTAPTGSLTVHADFTGMAIEFFGIVDLFLTNPKLPNPSVGQVVASMPSRVNPAVLQLITNLAAVQIFYVTSCLII